MRRVTLLAFLALMTTGPVLAQSEQMGEWWMRELSGNAFEPTRWRMWTTSEGTGCSINIRAGADETEVYISQTTYLGLSGSATRVNIASDSHPSPVRLAGSISTSNKSVFISSFDHEEFFEILYGAELLSLQVFDYRDAYRVHEFVLDPDNTREAVEYMLGKVRGAQPAD